MSDERLHPNEAFRHWTRGVSFTLAMGKTQVATLVAIHLSKDMQWHVGREHKSLRCWVTAIRGLEERGIVIHHKPKKAMHATLGDVWEISGPGEHVIALLQASGIYEELRREFAASDRQNMERSA